MAAADQIHVGKDGFLFLLQGNNNVSLQYAKSTEAQNFLIHWQTIILARKRKLANMGISYRHVFIPEKITIYDNLLNGLDIDWTMSPAFRLYHEDQYFIKFPLLHLRFDLFLRRRSRWRSTLIDLIGPMRRRRSEQDLYYRTDSHLSFAGRVVAYREICRAVDARPVRDFWERPTTYHSGWAGDLGIAFDPPRYEGTTLHHIQRDAVRVYASPIVERREQLGLEGTLHTGAHVVYRNARAADARRVILFGDSYANCLPNGLTIMLAETFRELHFIWSTQLDYGYIERVRPDLVLTEMSERFVFRSVDDGWSMDRYAQQRYGAELAAAPTTDAPPS